MENLDPIVGGAPLEIPLERSPLVRVIAQIRFPMVAAVGRPEFMSSFQEALRKTYPILRAEKVQSLVLRAEVPNPVQMEQVWRFSNIEESWRVGLAPTFVSIETGAYTSRTEFLERFKEVIRALERYVQPAMVDRLGIRFINRLSGTDLKDLQKLFRPELCGVVNTLTGVQHSLTETAFRIEKNALTARWGLLPPELSPDPAVQALSECSWVLDFDMYTTETSVFDTKIVMSNSLVFMERIYSLFRWSVTAEFLKQRGGRV